MNGTPVIALPFRTAFSSMSAWSRPHLVNAGPRDLGVDVPDRDTAVSGWLADNGGFDVAFDANGDSFRCRNTRSVCGGEPMRQEGASRSAE
ncbi:hypothetical protein [Arthrobacter sp. TMN-50]